MRGFGNPQLKASEFGNSEEHPFCWALTTCGDNMGEAMTILNKDLAKNTELNIADGQPLQAETLFSVIMPESYVCLPFMKTDTEEKEAMKIELAELQLPHIIQMIEERRRGIEELDKGATPRLYSYVIGGYFNKRMITDRKFTVDEDVCIKCGKCAKVCPVDNIKGTPPAWIHNGRCTCCLACYHHCPVHAINYGSITRRRGQYYFKKR
jgi:ferredoxin